MTGSTMKYGLVAGTIIIGLISTGLVAGRTSGKSEPIEMVSSLKPNILTDHHEQGSNASFFFQPGVPFHV